MSVCHRTLLKLDIEFPAVKWSVEEQETQSKTE